MLVISMTSLGCIACIAFDSFLPSIPTLYPIADHAAIAVVMADGDVVADVEV